MDARFPKRPSPLVVPGANNVTFVTSRETGILSISALLIEKELLTSFGFKVRLPVAVTTTVSSRKFAAAPKPAETVTV